MNFIKKTIIGIIKWASSVNHNEDKYAANEIPISKSRLGPANDISDSNHGMNFTVYSAIGGKVIQIRSYDPLRDRNTGSLYVITDHEDLGVELGQIITRESLSR